MKKIFVCLYLMLHLSLSSDIQVLALAGSTRSDSYNKKLVQEAGKIARQHNAKVTYIDLKDYPMPFYDADLEMKEGLPLNAKRLRDQLVKSDFILIASPEYNGSIPAVLKNALDWATRDENGNPSKEAFKGKKFGLMSASPGKKGGAKGLIHLRAIIEDCGGEVINKQVSLGNAHAAFDEKGELVNNEIKKNLNDEVKGLLNY